MPSSRLPLFSRALAWAFLSTLATAAPPKPPNSVATEDVTALSPFTVTADSIDGYTASQTLSGTRLRSEARDVGTAMSILTPEFLDDIGATNITSAFDFAPSTETFRISEADVDGNSSRSGNTFIVRGFTSSSLSLNFFRTNVRIDRYNTETFSFNRGPNSILFGTGTPGGLIDTTTKQARLGGTRSELELRYGSAGSGTQRATFDQNFGFARQHLAVRVAGLFQEGSLAQTPTRDDRRSLFLTATYVPFKGTIVRFNAERGLTERVAGRQYVAFDFYTPWVNAGRPLVTGTAAPANRAGLEANSANFIVKIEGANVPVMNWAGLWRGARPQINGAFRTDISVTDESMVSYTTNVAGPHDLVEFDYQNYAVFVEQRIGPSFALEAAAAYEPLKRNELMGGRGLDYGIRIDASRTLPDGSANPFAGMPYVETQNYTMMVSEVYGTWQSRVTASYHLDLRDRGGRWFNLGRYQLAGFAGGSRDNYHYMNGDEVNAAGTNPNLSNTVNRLHRRTYLVPGGPRYFNPAYEPVIQSAGTPATAVPAVRSAWLHTVGASRRTVSEIGSLMFVGQAHYLQDRLVFTVGVREDRSKNRASAYTQGADGQWPTWEQGQWLDPIRATAHTRTFGAVAHATPQLSVYVNRSDNFNPPSANTVDIWGRVVPPQAGTGTDVGLKFNLGHNRLIGSLGYFEASYENEATSTLRSAGNKGSAINDMWAAVDPAKTISRDDWSALRNTTTHGVEFQAVFTPTRSWRLTLNGSRNLTKASRIFPEVIDYLATYRPLWQAAASRSVTSNFGTTVGQVLGYLDDQVALSLAELGRRGLGQREWMANLVTAYQFGKESRLNGWTVGSTARWRSAPTIGFALDSRGVFDKDRPFIGKQQTIVDSWVGYRLTWRKSNLSFRLRVENLLDEKVPYLFRAVDDGHGQPAATQRLVPAYRAYTLSTSVAF